MSLRDFWDNITTPGFIGSKIDELNQINKEAIQGFQEAFDVFKDKRELTAGDVIGVSRGIYDHFGIYIGNNRVIHYSSTDSCNKERNKIIETDINLFLRGNKNFHIIECEYVKPKTNVAIWNGIIQQGPGFKQLHELFKSDKRFVYSGSETISRAKQRLGEDEYSLIMNNCEHFAIWCKTGESKSHQVEAILNNSAKFGVQH